MFRRAYCVIVRFAIALLLLACGIAHAQDSGAVSGVVVNSYDGTPLAGAAVTARGTTLATQTDSTGRFELKNLPPGDQVLRISKSGFAAAVVTDVRVLPGQTTTVNGNLHPEFYEMEEFEVTAEEFTQQTEEILIERQQSSGMMDAIGSEQFSKLGAGDAAEIVTRVTGVTVVEGKFAVIRGLNDRYTSTLLNGAEVPSADPYRRAAQLDMFPSAMIERVTINKTFTPDQPGGFAGGSINLITKPFPEKPFIDFAAGVAYNTQATGNPRFLGTPEGGSDYLAMDDGFRSVPRGPVTEGQGPGSSIRDNKALADQVVNQLHALKDPFFAPTRSAPGPDTDWGLSLGGTKQVFDEVKVGFIGGLNHGIKYRYYEDGEFNRFVAVSGAPDQLSLVRGYTRDRGSKEVQWGGVAGVALELTPHHRLSYSVLNNQSAENVGQIQRGQSANLSGEVALAFKGYTERNLFNQQFKGEHEIEALHNLNLDWLVSMTDTSQAEPSLRYYPMQLTASYPDGTYDITSAGADIPDARAPTIYSRLLTEQNRNYLVDFTLPFGDSKDTTRNLKFGLNLSSSERQYEDQRILFEVGQSPTGDRGRFETFPNQKLDLSQFGYTAVPITRKGITVTNFIFDHPISHFQSSYQGTQELPAGYLMGDWAFANWLRVMGGVRYETTDMKVSTSGGIAQINEQDLLPAVGVTFSLRKDMNVRLNYSQTMARPTYREFAPVSVYDFYADEFIVGNPTLKIAHIENFDLRWEWFPAPGEVLSAGVFYKELTDSIEKYQTKQIETLSFINRPGATLYGLEVEARKNLGFLSERMSGFSLGGNFTYIDGSVTLDPLVDADGNVFAPGGTRDALFDQSQFIINADLSFDAAKAGFSGTLSFNVSSERLVVAGANSPDVYEQPAPSLDLVLSQRLGKHFKVKLSAKNLLNPEIKQIYGKQGAFPQYGPYSSYTRGITFGLSLSGEF